MSTTTNTGTHGALWHCYVAMSINWVLTTADGAAPEPLPAEVVKYRSPVCQLHLEFKNVQEPVQWRAEGVVHVTNQRVVFLRHPPLPPPADPSQPSPHLRSLAIPLLNHLLALRYVMPIFAAPYLELKLHPVRDGGLPQDGARGPTTADELERRAGVLRLTFAEGGGTVLKEAIDRALRNPRPLAGRPRREGEQEPDPLPLYTAPGSAPSPVPDHGEAPRESQPHATPPEQQPLPSPAQPSAVPPPQPRNDEQDELPPPYAG